jgi:HlyD family secretion protein
VFAPVSSPYDSAIYANGIVESDQSSGSNINIFPEVSGPITKVLVREGQQVSAGAPLFTIDDSVQRATTEQLRLQAEAALALLNELKAEPRPETLAVAVAQVGQAESNLKAASDQYDKDRASYDIDPKSISKDVLDTAETRSRQADAGLDVARKQYELTKAGAWSYDIANQEKQYEALQAGLRGGQRPAAQKYSVKAPIDGVVLSVYAAVGSYVSSQGAYDPYTEAFDQLVIMGPPQDYLAVRCYVDEILVSRLPSKWHITAQMSITGTDLKVPLEFVRVQPYVSPKIELSNERQEKVDLRVLPVIFRFQKQDLPGLSGPAGRCLHRAASSAAADPKPIDAHAMKALPSSVRRAPASAWSSALLGACAVGPDFVRPAPPDADRYTREPLPAATVAADGQAQQFTADAPWPPIGGGFSSPSRWTRPSTGRRQQPDAPGGRGQPAPEPGQPARGGRRVLPANRRRGSAPAGSGRAAAAGPEAPGTIFNLVTLSGTISYRSTCSAGERRTVEGLRAQADYQRYANLAAYLTLSANVVNASIARAAYAAEIRATEQLIDLEDEQLRLTEAQVRAGTLPTRVCSAVRSLIAANQALLAPLRSRGSARPRTCWRRWKAWCRPKGGPCPRST